MAKYTFFTHPMSRGQIAPWALHEAAADYDQVLGRLRERAAYKAAKAIDMALIAAAQPD